MIDDIKIKMKEYYKRIKTINEAYERLKKENEILKVDNQEI